MRSQEQRQGLPRQSAHREGVPLPNAISKIGEVADVFCSLLV